MTTLAELTIQAPPPGKADWNDVGVVIKKALVPYIFLEDYKRCWDKDNKHRPGGWPINTPYRHHRELLDLVTFAPIARVLEELLGEPAGVHLNLTGWVSTERDWHQDSYLNPPHVGDYYAAIWIALEDIHPDSGPFQYVPGSHRWPVVTYDKILAALSPAERDEHWPKHSERILTPLFTQEIAERQAKIVTYLPRAGDVLFWHGRLLHRGSKPNVQGMRRCALIAHYSGINHRSDMPLAVQVGNAGWCFPIDG